MSSPPSADRERHPQEEPDRLLTPGEVAELFGVDPATVTRWSNAGRLRARRTPGGHRRFRASEVQEMLERVRNGDGGAGP